MSTTNVKILLRRGLRKDISHDTLETGEMGFAMDTNQLYVGIDPAINEVQFDPFANAQNIIQSWLNGPDNPEAGLTVDEDLIIRNVSDVDALLSAMHYFEQTVEFDSEIIEIGDLAIPIAGLTTFTLPSTLTNARPDDIIYNNGDGDVTLTVSDYTWDNATKTITLNTPIQDGADNDSQVNVKVEIHREFTVGERLYQYQRVDSNSPWKIHTSGEILSYTIDPTTKQTTVTVKVPEPSQDPFSNISYTGFHVENQTDEDNYYFSTLATGTIEPIKATSVSGASEFDIGLYGRSRRNVEVVTENTYNQMFADQHLVGIQDVALGIRPSLFRKHLAKKTAGPDKLEIDCRYRITNIGTNANAQDNWNTVAGTTGVTYAVGDTFTAVTTVTTETDQGSAETFDGCFMSWEKNTCTSFFIDYSLVQKKDPNKFVRVGTIKVINGVPQGINKIKLTDDNTEIWQDFNTDGIADIDEFSNIEFSSKIEGNNIKFMYKQDFDWETEISYTIKRWTM